MFIHGNGITYVEAPSSYSEIFNFITFCSTIKSAVKLFRKFFLQICKKQKTKKLEMLCVFVRIMMMITTLKKEKEKASQNFEQDCLSTKLKIICQKRGRQFWLQVSLYLHFFAVIVYVSHQENNSKNSRFTE